MAIGNRAAIAALLASGLGLTACASPGSTGLIDPKYPTRTAQSAPRTKPPITARPSQTPQSGQAARRGGTWKPYQVKGQWYYPAEQPGYDETGIASWYGPNFDGKPTANGETFDQYGLSAAHKTLPIPSVVEVTNLDNGRSLTLRINDRGPFVDGRIIDLSRGAAEQLGVVRTGVANVRVRYVGPGSTPGLPADDLRYAAAAPPPHKSPPPKPVVAPPPALPEPEPVLAEAEAPSEFVQAEPVQPDPARTPPAADTPSAIFARYEIQAGAFSTRANAERAARDLAPAGETEIREIDRNGKVLYRVFVSRLTSESAAEDALGKVAASGYQDAMVRRLN